MKVTVSYTQSVSTRHVSLPGPILILTRVDRRNNEVYLYIGPLILV